MHQYRITKYDPRLRNPSGAYPIDEWTSRSDVGKEFDGVPLTEDAYLRIELAYIESAVAFLDEAGISEMTVVGLENHGKVDAAPKDGMPIKAADIPLILRSMLREDFWCKLECPAAFIHIGYDYYMYIGTPIECVRASAFAQSNGLFVEMFESPYAKNAA